MTPKLYIKTMGCQMNEYDSEKMADVLRVSHGYELTSAPEDADFLLVNTCSIREKAQEKVFSELGRWRVALPVRKVRAFENEHRSSIWYLGHKPCTDCLKWLMRSVVTAMA
jgi:hypothetical protein